MKYYKLKKDLPTFRKGEIFFIDGRGHLISRAHENVVAYTGATIALFPGILKDWFEEVSSPERDSKTKYAFMEYISDHKEERFFQAVRNFAKEYLGDEFSFIYASKRPLAYYIQHYDKFQDTFTFECDQIHEILKEEE